MSNFSEIAEAVKVAKKYGLSKKYHTSSMHNRLSSSENEANLNCMEEFKKIWNKSWIFRSYKRYNCGIVAASRGANIIEKHFTLNKRFKGPDHKASLDFNELKDYNNKIKMVKLVLGAKLKITFNESKNIRYVRKSLYAKKKF